MSAPCRHRADGLSLIELMIALSIGTLLALGVMSVFLASRESAVVESALSRVQQSGRAAVELVNKDIRRAGYIGCSSIGGRADVAATGFSAQRLTAYTRASTAATLVPSVATGDPAYVLRDVVRPGTDILVVDYADYFGNDLVAAGTAISSVNTAFSLASVDGKACGLAAGDLLLLSNCLTTHIFRLESTSACSGGSTTVTLTSSENAGAGANAPFLYEQGSDVAEYFEFLWYVADTGRDQNGQDVFALYRLASNQPVSAAQEMVEGVEFFRVEVGERVGNALRFAAPGAAGIDWDNIEAVRFAMLVQSFDAATESVDTATYQLLSNQVPATGTLSHGGGRVVRRVYTSSQTIRNTEYGRQQ